MESGMENSLAWFKKKSLSEDIAKELYNSMVKVSLDSETVNLMESGHLPLLSRL